MLVIEGLGVDIRRNETADLLDLRMNGGSLSSLESLQVPVDQLGHGDLVLLGILLGELEILLGQAHRELGGFHLLLRTASLAVPYGSGKRPANTPPFSRFV